MLIIPELKVIFIRPEKISGTSFTRALLRCINRSDKDIAYQIKTLQNATSDSGILIDERKLQSLTHAHCHELKAIINRDIWDDYFKISIIRCPYDLMLSYYYWINFRSTVNPKRIIKNFNLLVLRKTSEMGFKYKFRPKSLKYNYTGLCIDNRSAIDFLIRYENRNEDIKELEERINCPGLLEKYNEEHCMKNIRPPGQDVNKVYAKYKLARAIIDKEFTDEMGNELIRRYYPLYKKKLDEKVPEPSYFLMKIAGLLIYLYKRRPKSSYIYQYLKRLYLRLSRISSTSKKLV